MMTNETIRVRTADRLLDDEVRQTPVDVEREAVHRRLLHIAVPWLWFIAPPWLIGSLASRWLKH
jgi:hypothetical protein